jgi:CheY-like chemotaxis protein
MVLSDANILVVDDEPELLDIYAEWLARAGCKSVKTAKDGDAALAAIAEWPIDMLLTDVRMPVMDGVTLVRSLAKSGKPIPSVVFISGFGDVDKREMYALGVGAFLVKPCQREELVGAIENALADRSTLWNTPLKLVPRQSIVIEVDHLDETLCPKSLQLGNSGFSAFENRTLGLGNVAFQCDIASDQQRISGQGYVRWNSQMERKIGVEFAFIEEPGRTWLLGEIKARNPRSFIPGS